MGGEFLSEWVSELVFWLPEIQILLEMFLAYLCKLRCHKSRVISELSRGRIIMIIHTYKNELISFLEWTCNSKLIFKLNIWIKITGRILLSYTIYLYQLNKYTNYWRWKQQQFSYLTYPSHKYASHTPKDRNTHIYSSSTDNNLLLPNVYTSSSGCHLITWTGATLDRKCLPEDAISVMPL